MGGIMERLQNRLNGGCGGCQRLQNRLNGGGGGGKEVEGGGGYWVAVGWGMVGGQTE